MTATERLLDSASPLLERVPKDAGIAALVGLVQLCVTLMAGHWQQDRESIDALGVLLLLAGPAALVWRTRAPATVLAVALAPALAYWLLEYPRGPVFLAATVAFITVVVRGRRELAWVALAVCWAGLTFGPDLVGNGPLPPFGKALGTALWLVLVAFGAEVIRVKRERHAEEERARKQKALTQAGQERLRIARELHDVLAHNVALINVQAGVALHLLDEHPERARPALEAIKQASSDALGEMRSVLGVLRRPGEQPPRAPTAGLDGLGELVERTTAAGIPVETDVRGEPRPLPASVDLALYRIVQEALTNVARHARPAAAVVSLAYGDDDVTVRVDDRGERAVDVNGRAGNGIAGMRERVAALGGDFSAGPRRDASGFSVEARLPLDGNQ